MPKTIAVIVAIVFSTALFAQSLKLPPPDVQGGKSLMWCLNNRKSQRSFNPDKKLSDQQLSNLLWAAFGVNRKDGKRTAPSARNMQEITIYVAMKSGLYTYDAKKNILNLVMEKDIRSPCGFQKFHADAPVDLIYVANLAGMGMKDPADKEFYATVDCGYISQNVYLYCTSEGLATVVCGWIDRDKISKALKLSENHMVLLSQPVGYPK